MDQVGSHVEHEHNPFIKRFSRVNLNMTRTRLASTHDLFINRLVCRLCGFCLILLPLMKID